jgi:predicted TIM-barrel fold metal-dependent hydrolase
MGELGIQYAGIAVDDPRMTPFFDLSEEFDVPVLIHHHGTAGSSNDFRISLGHPEQLEELLVQRPKLRLFIETSGFPYLEETIALMYRYPNVYGDLSLWKYPPRMADKYLRDLTDAGLGKRIMFASDQGLYPEVIDEMIDLVDSAEYLSDDQKRDIFYNNAARFLRLSEDEIAKHYRR